MAFGWLRYLIACAYGLGLTNPADAIVGGPSWIDVDRFDIRANAPPERVPHSQLEGLPMLRALLAERFKLAAHREVKEVPMYALVIARKDGRLGPRLHPTSADCATWIAGGRRGAPPPVPGDLPCGRQLVSAFALRGTAMPLSQFVNQLSARVQRPVRDQTGLKGTFALNLQWRPDREAPDGGADALPTSVFSALQEQLGLKLEPTSGVADRLIIDHVEHPSEN